MATRRSARISDGPPAHHLSETGQHLTGLDASCPCRQAIGRIRIPRMGIDMILVGAVKMPVVVDRCLQAMVKNALEPAWEARFEGSSYGFRPGRGCHDAIEKIYGLARPNKTKKWVLDADIKGAFDNISHDYLLNTIGPVPGRELIKQWLKAGYVEQDGFHATEQGTPQGGVVTPLTMLQKRW